VVLEPESLTLLLPVPAGVKGTEPVPSIFHLNNLSPLTFPSLSRS